MGVQGKSIYEDASPDDGFRVLTTNYWPRGISRERAGTYLRLLGPSRELLGRYKDGAITWDEYESRYRQEMSGAQQLDEIAKLAERAASETVTVMCVCKDDAQCHRRLLRDLIQRKLNALGVGHQGPTQCASAPQAVSGFHSSNWASIVHSSSGHGALAPRRRMGAARYCRHGRTRVP